jgi:hypothetical protein
VLPSPRSFTRAYGGLVSDPGSRMCAFGRALFPPLPICTQRRQILMRNDPLTFFEVNRREKDVDRKRKERGMSAPADGDAEPAAALLTAAALQRARHGRARHVGGGQLHYSQGPLQRSDGRPLRAAHRRRGRRRAAPRDDQGERPWTDCMPLPSSSSNLFCRFWRF